MIEVLLGLIVIGLSAAGLGLGLFFGRRPGRTGCAAAADLPRARCADCPLRRRRRAGEGAR